MLLCWIWLAFVVYYLLFRYSHAAHRYMVFGEERYGKIAPEYAIDTIIVAHLLPILSIKSIILCSLSVLFVLFILIFLADNYQQDWQLEQIGFPFRRVRRF